MLMHYKAAQAWQRTMMDGKHYWIDDLRYIARWLRTFFGDTIQAHFLGESPSARKKMYI